MNEGAGIRIPISILAHMTHSPIVRHPSGFTFWIAGNFLREKSKVWNLMLGKIWRNIANLPSWWILNLFEYPFWSSEHETALDTRLERIVISPEIKDKKKQDYIRSNFLHFLYFQRYGGEKKIHVDLDSKFFFVFIYKNNAVS